MKVQSAERIETAESKGKAEAYITQGVRLVIAGLHERSLEVSKCVRSCIWIDKPPTADVALLHLFSFYISRFPYDTSLSFRPKKKTILKSFLREYMSIRIPISFCTAISISMVVFLPIHL